jgi:anthranilate phosphoribosyltransferase
MKFKELLEKLYLHDRLSEEEAFNALIQIAKGEANPSQIVSFITVFLMRSIEPNELLGFRRAMLELATRINVDEFDVIDVCGTGGDGKNTFNISTTAMFVAAAAGVKIAKHGNYAISSSSGSSNVLEFLGLKFTNDPIKLKRSLDESGICVLHAPLFHPSMKQVAPYRKELGVKTFFNILGPISNPAQPKYQVTGVYDLSIFRLYGHAFHTIFDNYKIVHSLDCYDEISLTGFFKIKTKFSETLYRPSDWGLGKLKPQMILGGSIEDSAKILVNVLKGEGTKEQHQVVAANAALAIHLKNNHLSEKDCVALALDIICSGKAIKNLEKLITCYH